MGAPPPQNSATGSPRPAARLPATAPLPGPRSSNLVGILAGPILEDSAENAPGVLAAQDQDGPALLPRRLP